MEWVTHEAVVFGLCGESVGIGKVVLVSAPKFVTSEVTSCDAVEERVGVGIAELVCTPG